MSTRANVTKSVMKTTDGKFLKIQTIDDTLKLCVEEIQNADNKALQVIIHKSKEKLAYKFRYKESRYWLKADGHRNLECVKDEGTNSVPFWFEREDQKGSEQYSLQFTHNSIKLYLSTKPFNDFEILTITDDPFASLILTHV